MTLEDFHCESKYTKPVDLTKVLRRLSFLEGKSHRNSQNRDCMLVIEHYVSRILVGEVLKKQIRSANFFFLSIMIFL